MSNTNVSIRVFLANFEAGLYYSADRKTQCEAGWYDWFCKDTSLRNKTIALTKKLKQIVDSPKIDQDTMYVWFKNNCPMWGSLYDDFRIADLATGNTIFCVTPSSGHNSIKGQASVWSVAENKEVAVGTWKDVKAFFKA